MELFKKRAVIIYLLILIAHCSFIYLEWNSWRFYSKLLLVPFLMLLLYAQYSGDKWSKTFLLPVAALAGSFMGDLLLAFDGATFFLLGMLGFMVTHICNSFYFYSLYKVQIKESKNAKLALLILTITCSLLVFVIKDNTGPFFLAIIIYMILISVMTILSANLADSKWYNNVAIHYFIPGAGLFVLSDGLLAINKFNLQDPSMDIFVMLTYGLAQLYIVMGYYKTKY
jgi:uncharacterized membrane protein YhhN